MSELVVGFGDRLVLDGLSLDMRRGEVLGLVGGSGSGKSVLLRTIIGLIPRRAGTVEVFGIDLAKADDAERRATERRWGVLYQQGALFSSLTVKENVKFPMREYLKLSDTLMDEVAMAKLEMVGLGPHDAEKLPAELSGGMTKRVALARALALDPEIVFLDEPTSGLDPITAGDLDTLIETLKETLGLTVFMVTHDLDSLYTVCTRIAALADGRIVANGPMSTMLASEHPWVRAYFHGKRAELSGVGAAEKDRIMEIRARFVLIGLFALAVIVAGFGFVYWMENTAGLGQRTLYQVRFDHSVSGLLLGSPVQFNGIRVGEVTDLTLNPSDPRQVLVTIAVSADTPVRADTTAGLVFGGLTGVPEIALTGGSPDAPPPPASDGGPPLLIAQASLGDWTQAAREAFTRIDTLLSDNSDTLKDTLGNLDTFSQALARNSGKLDGIVEGLARLTGGTEKTPPNVVELTAPNDFPPLAKEPSVQLAVLRPSAPVALETQRILIETDGSMAPAFPDTQWSDSVPLLIQAKIIESFENAGYPRIATDMSGLAADYQLAIDLRAFRISGGATPQADVDLTAKLVDSAGAIVSAKRFQASAPVSATDAAAAAAALNQAFAKTATDLVGWTLPLLANAGAQSDGG